MKTTIWMGAAAGALVLAAAWPLPALADFELDDAKGKRILLKDDGTWQYKNATASAGAASEPAKEQPQADLLPGAAAKPLGGLHHRIKRLQGLGGPIWGRHWIKMGCSA